MKTEWVRTEEKLPPENLPVETMSESGQHQILVRKNNLWFFEDGSMYVYYTPVSWKMIR
jgi:hypothetical protein